MGRAIYSSASLGLALFIALAGCAPRAPYPAIPEAGPINQASPTPRIPAADPLAPASPRRSVVQPVLRPPVVPVPPVASVPRAPRAPRANPALAPRRVPPAVPPRYLAPPVQAAVPELVEPAVEFSGAGDYMTHPALQALLGRMQQVHGFDANNLHTLFAQVRRSDEIIRKASTPAEAKSWAQYRPIFLTEDRIQSGVNFWQQHADVIAAAAAQYAVDPAYIVAIIGVETQYGRNLGKYPVLQALTTLSFDFPKRADFYQKELEQYLLLTRSEQLNPLTLVGSYAGAMGLGQFIASSYREYAQDFNGDGRRDLWSAADAIASVAHYLARHGWRAGEAVAAPAYVSGSGYARLLSAKPVKPSLSLASLAALGITPAAPMSVRQAAVIALDGAAGAELWVTGTNFYVITRYNHSDKYAMAVHQLAQALSQRMGQ